MRRALDIRDDWLGPAEGLAGLVDRPKGHPP
jgi:hypothetical protein